MKPFLIISRAGCGRFRLKRVDYAGLIKQPFFLLSLQALLMLAVIYSFKRFHVETVPDSDSYLSYFKTLDGTNGFLNAIFIKYRTIGYPAFLWGIAKVSPSYSILPLAHCVVHVISVLFFFRALCSFGFSPWPAFVASSPLFYSDVVLRYISWVSSDSIAASMGIMCIAMLLFVISHPRKLWLWIGLSLFVFISYQMRPIYLFLMILIPCLGLLLSLLRCFINRRRIACFGIAKLASSLFLSLYIPLVVFCAIRWVTIGQLNLTLAGAVNGASVTMPLLTKDIIPKLPSELRALAAKIVDEREKRGIIIEPLSILNINSYLKNVHYAAYSHMLLTVPIVRTFPDGVIKDWLITSRCLASLSSRLILLRPQLYAQIVIMSIVLSHLVAVSMNLGIQISFLVLVFVIFTKWNNVRHISDGKDCFANIAFLEVIYVVLISILYFECTVVLLAFVSISISRYIHAASLFIPSAILLSAYAIWSHSKMSEGD